MAWPVDQSGLNRDSIYYRYHSADPSPFVPLPQLPDLSWGSPADGVHLWGCYPPDCLSCRAMPASAPSTWVALTGPNPTNPDPAAAISSFHQEPQSKPQKKGNTKQTPGYGASLSISIYHCICPLTTSQSYFGCSPAMQVGRLPLLGLFQP